MHTILVINPGSTSTKIALFRDKEELFNETLRHSVEELAPFKTLRDQKSFRTQVINNVIVEKGYSIKDLNAIVGRGGLLRPIEGGTYAINDAMLKDLESGIYGEHASNLGALIAREMSKDLGLPHFIVDPVVVDELSEEAKITGYPLIEKRSIFHALNQRAVAKAYAEELKKPYESLNLIVAHLGGGVSVGMHKQGKVVEVNNALDGDGPFSPERSGAVPAGQLIKLCFSGKHTQAELYKIVKGEGGFVGYLGHNDMIEITKKAEKGSPKELLLVQAFIHQLAREIGSLAPIVSGKVDGVVISGGIAYSKYLMNLLADKISYIAPLKIYPGEMEMEALAYGGLRVLNKQEEAKIY